MERFNREILGHLDPAEVVRELRALAGDGDIALTCFEREHLRCHRSLVAEWLNSNGFDAKEFGL